MLVVPEFEGAIFCIRSAVATAFSGLLIPSAVSTVRVGADRRTALATSGFGNGFFALRDLSGESRLRGGLRRRRTFLSSVKQGRVLRSGQVCELKIRWSNRHGPVLPL